MADKEKDIEFLTGIGLTTSQAKVYLCLLTLGRTDGRTIWKNAKVARQDIYRILAELQEKGLVEKIIATPTQYKAIQIQDGLTTLLKHKAQEYQEAKAKAKELLKRLKAYTNKDIEENQFSLIPQNKATIRKFRTACNEAQKNVDCIIHWRGFLDITTEENEVIQKSLNRGVTFRFIVHNSQGEKNTQIASQTLIKNKSVNIRYLQNPPPATLTIFDKEKTLVTTSPNPNPIEVPSLWLKNPGLASIFQAYFEQMWHKSTEDNASPKTEPKTTRQILKISDPLTST